MRIALVSTPRSGNTWLRYLLADLHGLRQQAIHSPTEFAWQDSPDRTIVQVHWPPTADFLELLSTAQFTPLTVCRHPLDVLISILHFCRREPATASWLLGDGGDENSIQWAAPADAAFERYAVGPRARALLAISAAWWSHPGVLKVRYESLVETPEQVLRGLLPDEAVSADAVKHVVKTHGIEQLRTSSSNHHFWSGKPGIWQSLMPNALAMPVFQAHADVFDRLSYDVARSGAEPDQQSCSRTWARMAVERS